MPHSVSRQQICTVIWRRGVLRKEKKFYKDANQTENFIGVKTENNLYYRGKNIIHPNIYVVFANSRNMLSMKIGRIKNLQTYCTNDGKNNKK